MDSEAEFPLTPAGIDILNHIADETVSFWEYTDGVVAPGAFRLSLSLEGMAQNYVVPCRSVMEATRYAIIHIRWNQYLRAVKVWKRGLVVGLEQMVPDGEWMTWYSRDGWTVHDVINAITTENLTVQQHERLKHLGFLGEIE